MYLIRIWAFLLLSVSASFAGIYDLKPEKIHKNIYCFFGDIHPPTVQNKGFVSNICLVYNGENVYALDAGPSYKFAEELDAQSQALFGKPIHAAIITNYHDDRLQGASYFTAQGKDIYAHDNIKEDIANNPEKFMRMQQIMSEEELEGTQVITPNKRFIDSFNIRGEEFDIHLLKPSKCAETPSDILVYIPKYRFLFTGNILFDDRMINFAEDSDMEGWLEAIKEIRTLHPKTIIMGHGYSTSKTAYMTTFTYLTALRAQVKKAYDEGIDLQDIMGHIKLDRYKKLLHFDDLNGKNVYNYYFDLEMQ